MLFFNPLPLAVKRQVAFVALKHVHTGYIVQNALVAYDVPGSNIRAVADLEKHFFRRLHFKGSVNFLLGQLPKIRPYGQDNGFQFQNGVAVFVKVVVGES